MTKDSLSGSAGARTLTMNVGLSVVEHLGYRMYTRLPAVLGELISNAWDADAHGVEINVTGNGQTAEISFQDDGLGMEFQEVQDQYLDIGRNRRVAEGTDRSSTLRRPLMGRKGIGKLSVFGVARDVEVRTIKNGWLTVFVMNLDKMEEEARTQGRYDPRVIEDRQISPNEKTGTHVILRNLNRKSAIDVDGLRKNLARRFSVIGTDFSLSVNGTAILPEERDLRGDCQFVWEIPGKAETLRNATLTDLLPGKPTADSPEWRLRGWIGTFEAPVPESLGKGVIVMARGKLAQEPTFFNVGKLHGEHALEYIVGEIHADFLDPGFVGAKGVEGEDYISSYRGSIVWDSEVGNALEQWGQSVLATIARDWANRRVQIRESMIREVPEFREWYEHLDPGDQKSLDRIIGVVTRVEQDDPKMARGLMHYVIEAYEFKSYDQLIRSIEELPEQDAGKILELFREWKLIEARELFKIVQGRLAAIRRLQHLIDSNAKEVPDIHDFLVENPWLIHPTWTVVADEKRYSQLIKENFPEDKLEEADRRIDVLCAGVGGTLHVIELKRPALSVNPTHLQQLQNYIAFLNRRVGTVEGRSYTETRGYLVGGKLTEEGGWAVEQTANIDFYPYGDLLSNAENLHADFDEVFTISTARRPVLAAFARDAALVEVSLGANSEE